MNPSSSVPRPTPGAQRSIPLELDSRWFACQPPKFPYPSLRDAGPILSAYYAWESIEALPPARGEDWTLIGAVQWEDDPTIVTKIGVRWNSADINGARGEYKHVRHGGDAVSTSSNQGQCDDDDGERPLNAYELRLAAEWYGKHVAEFCETNIGFVVADGECWSLAVGALEYAGKQALKESHDPPMLSTGRIHGQCILDWDAGSGIDAKDVMAHADVCPGDILEMADAHFRSESVVLGMAKQMTNVRMRRHTAIILGCVGIAGTTLRIVEQNTKMMSRVTRGEYELGNMVAGTVKVYRPIGQSNGFQQANLKEFCEKW